MTEEHLNQLAAQLNLWINNSPIQANIIQSQYVGLYLQIFMEEADVNDGNPISYDSFGDKLWQLLNPDPNSPKEIPNDFMVTWTAWVHLYRQLKATERLNSKQQ